MQESYENGISNTEQNICQQKNKNAQNPKIYLPVALENTALGNLCSFQTIADVKVLLSLFKRKVEFWERFTIFLCFSCLENLALLTCIIKKNLSWDKSWGCYSWILFLKMLAAWLSYWSSCFNTMNQRHMASLLIKTSDFSDLHTCFRYFKPISKVIRTGLQPYIKDTKESSFVFIKPYLNPRTQN